MVFVVKEGGWWKEHGMLEWWSGEPMLRLIQHGDDGTWWMDSWLPEPPTPPPPTPSYPVHPILHLCGLTSLHLPNTICSIYIMGVHYHHLISERQRSHRIAFWCDVFKRTIILYSAPVLIKLKWKLCKGSSSVIFEYSCFIHKHIKLSYYIPFIFLAGLVWNEIMIW